MQRPTGVVLLGVLGLLNALGLGCRGSGKEADAPPPLFERDGVRIVVPAGSPLRSRIKIEAASEQVVQSQIIAPASVEANPTQTAKITPPLSGRVEKLFVHFGETVRKGQPLLLLQAPDLVTAQADYLRAKSTAALAERNFNRQKDLFDHGIGAQRDLDQSQNDRSAAITDLDRAKHRLQQLGVAIDAHVDACAARDAAGQSLRRVLRDDAAVIEEDDLVADAGDLVHLVAGVDDGQVARLAEGFDQGQGAIGDIRVQ